MNNTIQNSTWTSKEELDQGHISNDEIRTFLLDSHREITKKMEVLSTKQSRKFQMLCPHWRSGDEHHGQITSYFTPNITNVQCTTKCWAHASSL